MLKAKLNEDKKTIYEVIDYEVKLSQIDKDYKLSLIENSVDDETKAIMERGDNPLEFPGLKFTITAEESSQVTARETIADLETVPCDDTAKYVDCDSSDILEFLKGHITYEEYVTLKTPTSEVIEKKKVEEHYEQLSLIDLL